MDEIKTNGIDAFRFFDPTDIAVLFYRTIDTFVDHRSNVKIERSFNSGHADYSDRSLSIGEDDDDDGANCIYMRLKNGSTGINVIWVCWQRREPRKYEMDRRFFALEIIVAFPAIDFSFDLV